MQSAVLARELDAARAVYWEDPAGSLATAIQTYSLPGGRDAVCASAR